MDRCSVKDVVLEEVSEKYHIGTTKLGDKRCVRNKLAPFAVPQAYTICGTMVTAEGLTLYYIDENEHERGMEQDIVGYTRCQLIHPNEARIVTRKMLIETKKRIHAGKRESESAYEEHVQAIKQATDKSLEDAKSLHKRAMAQLDDQEGQIWQQLGTLGYER